MSLLFPGKCSFALLQVAVTMFSRKSPSEIRFSQDSIASHWKDYSSRIGVTLDQLLKGEITPDNIPTITVSIRHGLLYTSDNRRLWVFKKLQEFGKCESIKVIYGYINPRKFTTTNYGTSIYVRGDPGGSVWKMWRKDTVHSPLTENRYAVAGDNALESAFPSVMKLEEPENIRPADIRYFQIEPYLDGESLGSLLDEWLTTDPSKISLQVCFLKVFKLSGSYCTLQCDKLWVLNHLEKFGKSPKIRLKIENNPLEKYGDIALNFLRDSLEFGIDTRIGGSHWKNIDYLNKLPTIETIETPISDIFFTRKTISDSYANESIAKVLAHSYATMTIPAYPRVVKYEGKYYALDNEILWVLKGMQNMKSLPNLQVEINVKIEMDQPLFQGFAIDHIQNVTVRQTTFSHTNEESFIFECIKKMSSK